MTNTTTTPPLFLTTHLVLVLPTLGCWVTNLVKLIGSDFEAPYKREVVHGIGVLGPASLVTVWFNFEEGEGQ